MNRFLLSLRSFWKVLTDGESAAKVDAALGQTLTGPDLRVLAILQRDGRLLDFLQEDIDSYTDAQIGAAARDIHRGCRKVLRDYLPVEPVLSAEEGQRVTVEMGFDPASIRLTGNVTGSPPFQGILKHHGWRLKAAHLPSFPEAQKESPILAPAEVEVT